MDYNHRVVLPGTFIVFLFLLCEPLRIDAHCRGLKCQPHNWRGGAGILHEPQDPKPGTLDTRSTFTSYAASVVGQGNSPTLSINPSVLSAGESVTVAWTDVPDAQDSDWIGVYSPSIALPEQYIDYFYAKAVPGYKTGSGKYAITLIDMRTDYEVRYWRKSNLTDSLYPGYTLIAVSNTAAFPRDNTAVTQVHLSLTTSVNAMRVMFVTAEPRKTTVYYSEDPKGSDLLQATGTYFSYTADQMCGPPANLTGPNAWIDPGYIHDVVLDNLKPATLYTYWIGDVNPSTTPPTGTFRSSINDNVNPGRPIVFTAFGDLDESFPPGAITTLGRTRALLNETDFILHVGDLSYARGIGYKWEQFFSNIEPIASRVPYMICPGNHEIDVTSQGFHPAWGNYGDDSDGECGVPTFYRFHMPQDSFAEHNRRHVLGALEPPTQSTNHQGRVRIIEQPRQGHQGVHHGDAAGRFWYAYTYGIVRFVVMSTEHDYTPGSRQYEWLENELGAVNRTETPWLILAGHRPMYCSEDYMSDYNVTLGMQRSFEPLLLKARVDLALWGHYHSYERTCPVANNACASGYHNAKAPVHVVIGMSGATLDTATYLGKPWSVYHDQVFGFSRVKVFNASALYFAYYHNVDSALADDFWLTRSEA